jgi:hypothetical protein
MAGRQAPAGARDQGGGEAGRWSWPSLTSCGRRLGRSGGQADAPAGRLVHPGRDFRLAAGGAQGLGDQVREPWARAGGEPGLLEDDAEGGASVAPGTVAPASHGFAVEEQGSGVGAVRQGRDAGVWVDLPHPLGPRRPTASPGSTTREALRITGVCRSYPAVTARSSSTEVAPWPSVA